MPEYGYYFLEVIFGVFSQVHDEYHGCIFNRINRKQIPPNIKSKVDSA